MPFDRCHLLRRNGPIWAAQLDHVSYRSCGAVHRCFHSKFVDEKEAGNRAHKVASHSVPCLLAHCEGIQSDQEHRAHEGIFWPFPVLWLSVKVWTSRGGIVLCPYVCVWSEGVVGNQKHRLHKVVILSVSVSWLSLEDEKRAWDSQISLLSCFCACADSHSCDGVESSISFTRWLLAWFLCLRLVRETVLQLEMRVRNNGVQDSVISDRLVSGVALEGWNALC